MTPLTMRLHVSRRVEAFAFAILTALVMILALSLVGVSGNIRETIKINPGEYKVYELKGNQWSTIYLSVESTQPVTICITDSAGLNMLKSGKGVLCFFKAEGVTRIEKIWRFPKDGPLYLVLMDYSENEPAEVSLQVSNGLITWW